MKLLCAVAIWFVSALSGCVATDGCDDGRSWNEFYESCVDPCPANQDYDADGICVEVPTDGATPDSGSAHIR